jgi:hypothetical protein
MKKLLFVVVIALFGYSAFAQNTNKLLDNYLSVKNALVQSNSQTASEAIIVLQQNIKEDGSFDQKDALLKATETMAKAENIDKQRQAFDQVSTIMWKVVKGSEKVTEPVYYQYCPMKKTYWLSKEKEIKNPYYGPAMLTCGKVAETK